MRCEEGMRRVRREYAIAAVLLGMAAPLAAQQDTVPECECRRLRVEAPEGLEAFFHRGGEEGLRHMRIAVARARLGIELETDAAGDAAGARVRRVVPGSPAEDAGLRTGDEIVALDGVSLLRALPDDEPEVDEAGSAPRRRLVALMAQREPGDSVRLEVLRDGERMDVTVATDHHAVLAAAERVRALRPELEARLRRVHPELEATLRGVRPELEAALRELPNVRSFRLQDGAFGLAMGGVAGFRATALNADLASYFGVEEGVLVLGSEEDGSFDVRGGDVIVAVDGRAVREPAQLFRILRTYEDDEPVRLEVVRQGSRITVEGRGR